LRPDAVPIVDGDPGGDDHMSALFAANPLPNRIIRYGPGAAIECLAAWILEPALPNPGPALAQLLGDPQKRTLKHLQDALIQKKKDRELRETLAWESLDSEACCKRACEFFHDVAAITSASDRKNTGWVEVNKNSTLVVSAAHIKRAS
jgi:hypothetical protein